MFAGVPLTEPSFVEGKAALAAAAAASLAKTADSRPAQVGRALEQSDASAERSEWPSAGRSKGDFADGSRDDSASEMRDEERVGGEAASEAEPRLGNTAIYSSAITNERRQRRFELREKARLFADRTPVPYTDVDPDTGKVIQTGERAREDRFLACGHRSYSGPVGVVLDSEENRAGFSGLQSCGSVWACPVCAAKVQAHRAGELGQVLAWARREKRTVAMVTLTVRHSPKHPLVETVDQDTGEVVAGVWDAISSGWGAVTSGSQWHSETTEDFTERSEKWEAARALALAGQGRMPRGGRQNLVPTRRIGDPERFGIEGWARAVEVTHGLNGWHVHIHAVMILDGTKDEATANAFLAGSRMWERWQKGIAKIGFSAVKEHGLDIRVSAAAEKRLAEYLQKDGLDDGPLGLKESIEAAGRKAAAEAVMGAGKTARRGGRTPFQLLADIDPEAPGRDYHLWREWVEGSKGRRQLTWSATLRELAGLAEQELTPEEIAAQQPGGKTVVTLPADTWAAVRKSSWELLDRVEADGPSGLISWLAARGLDSDLVPEDDPPD